MELQQIRYFLAVAEELNFTRAAERCGVSQPALTRAIKRLEDELGAPLIRRERNKSHLTELGHMIRPRLEQALSLTEVVRSDADSFTRMSTASLTIGVMCTIGPSQIISLVDHLGSEFPQLTLTLRTSSGKDIIEWLLSGEIDVGILGMPHYPDEISVHSLYDERYMIACPPDHRFLKMRAVPIASLQGEKYVRRLNCEYMTHFESTLCELETNAAEILEHSMASIDVRHESEHENWIQSLVVAGMGCAVMPEYMSLGTELQMRPLVEPEIWRTIGLATVRGRKHTPAVGIFTELCRQMSWGTRNNEATDT